MRYLLLIFHRRFRPVIAGFKRDHWPISRSLGTLSINGDRLLIPYPCDQLSIPFQRDLHNRFSTDSTSPIKRPFDIKTIDRMLSSLESDRPYDNRYVLIRMPYICSTSEKKEFGARFVKIVDRWWSRVIDTLGNDLHEIKLTSTVHHLGRLNQEYGGIVVRKLAVDSIDRSDRKSLNYLVYLAGIIDFCTLPEREDVTSYLAGVRNLVVEPRGTVIAHRYLQSNSPEFFRNLERYVIEKAKSRRRTYLESGKMDEGDNWIFMITEESISILFALRSQGIDIQNIQNHTDRLLPVLCRLCDAGFDYYCSADPSKLNNQNSSITYRLQAFADNWLFWKFDPDTLAPGSWSKWFKVYEQCFANKSMTIMDGSSMGAVRCLSYLSYLPQVAVEFRKINHFLPLVDSWIGDVRESIESMNKKGSAIDQEYIDPLTDIVFDFGYIAKYLASIGQRKSIDHLKSTMPLVSIAVLDLIDPMAISHIALCRYLTGIRDFRMAIKSKENHPVEFVTKLLDFLHRYLDRPSITSHSKTVADRIQNSHNTAVHMLSLRQSDFPMDHRLWNSLIAVFEKEFVYICREFQSDGDMFDMDWKKLWITLVYLGDFSCYYTNSDKNFKVPKIIWQCYFSLAHELLRSVKCGQIGQSDSSVIQVKEYIYFVNVIMSVVRRFDQFEEFKSLQSIWEDRVADLIDGYDSRSAYLLVRKMKAVGTTSGVRFMQELYDKLREKGTEFAETLKENQKDRSQRRRSFNNSFPYKS